MKHFLEPFKTCEFARRCREDCLGKDPARSTHLSCGLRRGLLLMEEIEETDRRKKKNDHSGNGKEA